MLIVCTRLDMGMKRALMWACLLFLLVLSHLLLSSALEDHAKPLDGPKGSPSFLLKRKKHHELTLKHERWHGWISWASMCFMLPLGTLLIRMVKRGIQKGASKRHIQTLVNAHIVIQVAGLLLSLAGAFIALFFFSKRFPRTHDRLGLALYISMWLTTVFGIIRPKRTSSSRPFWFAFHWLFGTGTIILSILNSYIGLHLYELSSKKSYRGLNIAFSIQVAIFALIYLIQDRWDYMMGKEEQDAYIPTNNITSQGQSEKDKERL